MSINQKIQKIKKNILKSFCKCALKMTMQIYKTLNG